MTSKLRPFDLRDIDIGPAGQGFGAGNGANSVVVMPLD